MNTLTLITGGVFGWIFGAMLMACIVINSERQDRKRADRYERALRTIADNINDERICVMTINEALELN